MANPVSELLDSACPVRAGEELNLPQLESYLRAHLPDFSAPATVEQFPRGYSNLTYLLRCGQQEWVLRRPPFGNPVKTAHDMGREYRVLSALNKVYPPAPRTLLYCNDSAILGEPFYIMERRHGIILRQKVSPGLALDPDTARRLGEAFIDNLATLHRIDYAGCGLGDLGKPAGYVGRQVSSWIERYRKAQTDELPALDLAARWLADHQPTESAAALIHNDYKYDNLVLDPNDLTHIIAVLDWEMATLGDPLMDLGTTLGYWVEPGDPDTLRAAAFGPTTLPGSLTRRELVERYGQCIGRDVSDILFYYAFGLFKIAVIAQQIYARYKRGLTQDQRFARLIHMIGLLGEQAVQAIDTGRLGA
jgi:aminoglycoside phosphotransferase (APT) family kinase protein